MEGILPIESTVVEFLHRLYREEHIAKIQTIMRNFIAERILDDAPSEYVKLLYRAWEFTNMVRIQGWNELPEIHPQQRDFTAFDCSTSNMVNQIPPYISQSGPVLHHAADTIVASQGGGFLYGAYATNRALKQAHAFDKGKATILPWIERQSLELIEFTDAYKMFPGKPKPLNEFDSRDSLRIRAADFAVAVAREIWHRSSLVDVAAAFEYVT